MTIEERLAMVERKLEAFEAANRAQPDVIREQIRVAFQGFIDGTSGSDRIRKIAADGVGAALRDYSSRRG